MLDRESSAAFSGAGKRQTRVAFVLGQCAQGGTETQAELLIRGLRSRGVDVDVFVLEGASTGDQAMFADAPVKYLGTERVRGVRAPLAVLLTGLRLRRALRQQRYDVVHAALARAYVLAPLVVPLRHRPRVVVWRRNLGLHRSPRSASAIVEAISGRMANAVVANSESVRDYWVSKGHVRAEQMRVIGNALESWRFDPVEPEDLSPGLFRLVAVGGLRPVKGHELLLEAAAILRSRSVLAEVVILGEGPSRRALQDRASRLGVPLVAPGHVRDTRSWLASASVYVHPSYSEGASNAIAEAMAQGCAIVSTDVGGAAEMLGSEGTIVAAGDVVSLAAGIDRLLGDPCERLRLGDGSRARARELFALDMVIDQHLEVYAGVEPSVWN